MSSNHGIEGGLAAHDRYQFELKLGYTLDPSRRNNRYNVELYLFIPRSLQINPLTYSKRLFYSDVQGYIRFKTPHFSLASLLDTENRLSPLVRMRTILDSTSDRTELITELKLYACTLRAALRDEISKMRDNIKLHGPVGLKEMLAFSCGDLVRCLGELRGLRNRFDDRRVHDDVRIAYRHVDEYLGIMIDGLLNSLNNTIQASSLDGALKKDLFELIRPVIIDEYEHRKKFGYVTYEAASDNELFLFRKGFLKKIMTSILFLDTHTAAASTAMRDFIFAVAAGIAMVIATVITLWASRRFATSSLSFVLAVVIGYMMKDRIKDWCKLIFSNKMSRWLTDYKTAIIDKATDKKIGVCRHAFSFVPEKKVSDDIMRLRRFNTSADFWLTENIIKYEKEIVLMPGPILKAHTRLRDVTDIIRFNIQRFLMRMDEPSVVRRAIDPTTGKITDFKCVRDYHINAVLRLEKQIRRVRLVVNRNGIKRIDEVGAGNPI